MDQWMRFLVLIESSEGLGEQVCAYAQTWQNICFSYKQSLDDDEGSD